MSTTLRQAYNKFHALISTPVVNASHLSCVWNDTLYRIGYIFIFEGSQPLF